jgi:hypothetical protein
VLNDLAVGGSHGVKQEMLPRSEPYGGQVWTPYAPNGAEAKRR